MSIKKIKWMEQPERFFPAPKTIVNCIKWHIVLSDKANKIHREVNREAYEKTFICLTDLKPSPESDKLIDRDREYISSLVYQNVVLTEAAMLLGRELWIQKRRGSSEFDDELEQISLRDLAKWAEIFDVPLTIEAGGNLELAVEYTLGKKCEYLQCYVNALEGRPYHESICD